MYSCSCFSILYFFVFFFSSHKTPVHRQKQSPVIHFRCGFFYLHRLCFLFAAVFLLFASLIFFICCDVSFICNVFLLFAEAFLFICSGIYFCLQCYFYLHMAGLSHRREPRFIVYIVLFFGYKQISVIVKQKFTSNQCNPLFCYYCSVMRCATPSFDGTLQGIHSTRAGSLDCTKVPRILNRTGSRPRATLVFANQSYTNCGFGLRAGMWGKSLKLRCCPV